MPWGRKAIEEIAAARRVVETAEDVEQSRLSGPGRTRNRQPLATLQSEINIDERVYRRVAAEFLPDLLQLENRIRRVWPVGRHLASKFLGSQYPASSNRVTASAPRPSATRKPDPAARANALTGADDSPSVDPMAIVRRNKAPSGGVAVSSTRTLR